MDFIHILIMYNVLLYLCVIIFFITLQLFLMKFGLYLYCLIFHKDLLFNLDEIKKNELIIVYFYSLLYYKLYFMEMWR